ncbi:response regulator [Spirosoma agri]|uniref:Response regulator n=1 Tax=Spirosoma agri TaxID=1987381 RepID=A0A6M0IRQ8_9BACT|nr:response regulator [Spirosoma agri]NEU70950.1 response regulator [Spirosoma agri]
MINWPAIPVDLSKTVIDELPYGILVSDAIRTANGRIVNFRHRLFNQRAKQELPALANWFEGATMWELFKEDARAGLFDTYKTVYESGIRVRGVYRSPTTGKWYQSLIEPTADGVIAIGIALPEAQQTIALIDNKQDDGLLLVQRIRQHQLPLQVSRFESAKDFLHSLVEGHINPVLVLVELRLPGNAGLSTVSQLQAHWQQKNKSRLPAVVWSTDPSFSEQKACYQAGAVLVLNKVNYLVDSLLELVL